MSREQLLARIDALRSSLEKLARIPQATFDEFAADFRNVAAALYLLQTAIQALIDLAGHRVAERGLRTPRTSHETFEILEEGTLLPAGTAKRAAAIVGFRNRAVHLYDRIDERRVYEILTRHRRDLGDLLDLLLAIDEPKP